jgi:hypothetical protein
LAQSFRRIDWPPEVDAVLGQATDVDLGRALGVDEKTVAARRRQLGISPYRKPPRVLAIQCVVCGAITQTTQPPPGGRKSRLRTTCPPKRRGRVSPCQALLISRNLLKTMARYQPVSPRNLIKRVGGSSVVRLLDD